MYIVPDTPFSSLSLPFLVTSPPLKERGLAKTPSMPHAATVWLPPDPDTLLLACLGSAPLPWTRRPQAAQRAQRKGLQVLAKRCRQGRGDEKEEAAAAAEEEDLWDEAKGQKEGRMCVCTVAETTLNTN